jgi:twitching motility protein PilT
MNENTVPNNDVKFGYTSVPTTPAPVANDGMNQIAKDIDEINNFASIPEPFIPEPATIPEPASSYISKPTDLPNFDTQKVVTNSSVSTTPTPTPFINPVIHTTSSLDEIMPDPPKTPINIPKEPEIIPEEVKKESLDQFLSQPKVETNTRHSAYKIEDLLSFTISKNASDLHLSVGYPPIIRVDGELQDAGETLLNPEETEDLILSVLTDEKKEELQVNREVDFAYAYHGSVDARFRINAFYSMKHLCAAFRLIPSRIRTIEELMLPQIYHQFTQLKQGLVLVTGPTGHGKSTTLAAMLEDVNETRFSHIVTIEDPIEYVFSGKKSLIDQREMDDDTHSWDIALRSALRQDPDVLLVGEMRDYETISATITLAETGHLVFATLHTNSASQTIDRIIDVFPSNQQQQIKTQLSNILEAVIAQRLIPLSKGGRRAVSEIMIKNAAVANLIREGKTNQIDNVIRTSSDIGMISLEKGLVNLVREGVISTQEAQEYAVFPEEVLRLLKS